MHSNASNFNDIMRYLWGDDEPAHSFAIRAIGDNIRGRRGINPENAFDVLSLLGWPHKFYIRGAEPVGDEPHTEGHIAVAHVTFDDESQIIIEAPNGIGSGVEIVRG